ncbi:acetyl-CoA synthetase-like protein, partial [Lindgomyces ingoldianus]
MEGVLDMSVRKQLAHEFGGDPGKVEDILPCTPFQRDVVAWSASKQHEAVGHVLLEITNNTDIERLAAAWKKVHHLIPAFRTCVFMSSSGDCFQAILSEAMVWKHVKTSDLDKVVEEEKAAAIDESQWNRFAVVVSSDGKRRNLVWTFSYANFDNSFQERILDMVHTAYIGGELQPSGGLKTMVESLGKNSERAARFWQQRFDGFNAAVFPALSSVKVVPQPDARAQHEFSCITGPHQKRPSTVICRAALVALLSRYTHNEDVLFGAITERSPVLDGSEQLVDGPTRALVPVCTRILPEMSISHLMDAVAENDTAVHEFEQTGLRPLANVEGEESAAGAFQIVLAVTALGITHALSSALYRPTVTPDRFAPYVDRAILIHCHMSQAWASLSARYDPRVIDTPQINRFLTQLGALIQCFSNSEVDVPVRSLDMVTPEDRAEINSWNSTQPQPREVCIHDVISRFSTDTPQKPAVSAWDGQWTYAELENLSSRLAVYILSLNLDMGLAVPLCFNKSKWTVLGMLAVLKAGGAFTLIDPSLPAARIVSICQQSQSKIALVPKVHLDTMRTAIGHCIAVNDDLIQSLPRDETQLKPVAKPNDLAYILFTSGSTGEPKGCMIEHRGWASCALEWGPALGINQSTRAMQFASYTFGASLIETLAPLMLGGCVCIPSDDERMNDLPGFMKRAHVNWAFFTPSFAGTFHPDSVPGLQTLVLGGEQMSEDVKNTWAPRVRLFHAYG